MKFICAAVLFGMLATQLFAQDTASELRALKQQIEELTEKVKRLEEKNVLPEKTNEAHGAFVSAGASGFFMRSADTNFVLRIFGYGQFDGRFYAGESPAHDTFVMRRLRLGFEGIVYKYYDYKILTDFGSGINSTAQNNAFLQDALINFHYWPEFQIEFGKFKEPVSLESLQSDSRLLFVERGLPTLLVPNRDMGIEFHGDLFENRLSYAAGIFNGASDGGSDDIETENSGKHFAGRLFARPFANCGNRWIEKIAFGIGGSFGDKTEALGSYVTTGREKFFSFRTGAGTNSATANVTASGAQWRIAPQGYYCIGPFGIYGEYILSSLGVHRSAESVTPLRLDNSSWNIAASYVLTGEENTFDRVIPLHPVNFNGDGWGAWEIASRFGELSIDDSAFPLVASSGSAQKIKAWEVGLNWYLNKNVKFNLDYSQTIFGGEHSPKGSATAQDEKVFMGRTQFAF